MGITIGELLSTPHLRLRLHSGAAGVEREVQWTHTSDLPEPWQWLDGGELLMTNGMSFPATAEGQERLLAELARVGASGLAIGEEMYCPPLTEAFTRASERLGLPVLWIRYPLPFIAISRAVAEATLLEQSQRLMRTARIYDAIRHTATDGSERSRIAAALTRELSSSVLVCDRASGEAYYPKDPPVAPEVARAVRRADDGSLIAGARSVALEAAGREVLVLDVPTHDDAALAVVRDDTTALDGILLQHAATVVALELSQTRLTLEHRRRSGAELMAQLLDGRAETRAARRQLSAVALHPAHSVVISVSDEQESRVRELHVALWRGEIPHILAVRSGVAHVLAPATHDATATLVAALGPTGRAGVSAPLGTPTRASEAGREAVWALGMAGRSGTRLARYGESSVWTGFGDIDEAAALVEQHLRPLLTHDEQHQSNLVSTLEAFLTHQRSWQKTAVALQVHRQTVLYRIRRIEELTGRDVSQTSDLALLWMALQARDLTTGRGQPTGTGTQADKRST
ncbi:MAG: PucR family transcriptional regulator ligand-binding domain-containing protein [Knoellia sp.]